MAIPFNAPTAIYPSAEVPELGKYAFTVNYRGTRQPAILIRFRGSVYGYINRYVHRPRTRL